MENSKLINENQYFVESKKAIQIVLENEKVLSKKMKTEEKLQLVQKYLKNTGDPDEYDELEKLEKELKRKIKFHKLNEPAVPKEHQEKINRNTVIEQMEVDKLLNQLKAQLRFQYKYLEDEVLPLIINIEKLERLGAIPSQIDVLLNGEIGEETVFKIENLVKQQNVSHSAERAKETIQRIRSVIGLMRKMEIPVEINELPNDLKEDNE